MVDVKKAGDLLSGFFDERTMNAAGQFSQFFSSWDAVTWEQRIFSAAGHSQIVELERNVILIEADHPGWIQILQTKQEGLLAGFQRRFPSLAITGISFRLSRFPIPARSLVSGRQAAFSQAIPSKAAFSKSEAEAEAKTEPEAPDIFEKLAPFRGIIERLAEK
jgi:hypothetical protein